MCLIEHIDEYNSEQCIHCPGVFAQLSMAQNLSTCTPLLSMSGTILFRAIFQNGRHKNQIWPLCPAHTVLYSVQCGMLVHPSTNGTALYSVQSGMLVHPCADGTALYSSQCDILSSVYRCHGTVECTIWHAGLSLYIWHGTVHCTM